MLDVAIEAARRAGTVLLEHLHKPLDIEEKGSRADLVTQADRASDRVIIDYLRAATPAAAILGEESGGIRGSSDERWIVDPLDGTTNFAHGYPLFCISIAYERDGEVVAGIVYAPVMDELFAAERGSGATRNGDRISVSRIDRVADAMVCTGFKPSDYDRNAAQFARASRHAQAVRRDGAAALDLAYTAMGRFDGFWEFDLSPWDTAAGSLLVTEAGGRVSTLNGTAFAPDSSSILATNGAIHDEIRSVLLNG